MNPESALPGFRVDRGTTLAQRQPPNSPPVTRESPALDVVTELTQVKAATAPASSALAQCEQAMITQGVRMLLVTTELPAIDGVVTTTDLPASARCASWRGIVSRAQIERQLGTPIELTEVARTFAEIEQALHVSGSELETTQLRRR